ALLTQSLNRQAHYEHELAQTRRVLAEHQHRLDQKEALIARRDSDLRFKETTIVKLTHEIAVLRRFRFGKRSEQLSGVQGTLLEEAITADIAAIEEELQQLTDHSTKTTPRQQPRRGALPPQLPR